MTANVTPTSAKIYQFPVGGRRGANAVREQAKPAADVRLQLVSGEALGGGWYHDAAIQESKLASDH